jgi:hypothetical protein
MPTQVVVSVGPTGEGHDYTSLNAAEVGERTSLVDTELIFRCHGFADDSLYTDTTVPVEFHGDNWTLDATSRIIVERSEDRPNYRLQTNAGVNAITLRFRVRFTLRRMDIRNLHGGNTGAVNMQSIASADVCVVEECFLFKQGNFYAVTRPQANCTVRNNIVVLRVGGSIDRSAIWSDANDVPILNNTIFVEATGDSEGTTHFGIVSRSGSPLIRNNVVWSLGTVGATVVQGYEDDFAAAGSSNNASFDGTAPGSNSLQNIADPFVDAAALDAIQHATAVTIDAGADLSGVGVTVDFYGTTRPQGTAFDIGAHELEAVVGPTLEVTRTRWRNDDGDEATATYREDEDTPTTAQVDETVRLRAQIQATGDVGETAAELRWRKKGTEDPWEPVQ